MEKLISVALAAVFLLTACSKTEESKSDGYTFTDALGREVSVTSFEKTVIASGSLAEIWELAGGTVYGATDDSLDGHSLKDPDSVKIYGDVKNPSGDTSQADDAELVIVPNTRPAQPEDEDWLS